MMKTPTTNYEEGKCGYCQQEQQQLQDRRHNLPLLSEGNVKKNLAVPLSTSCCCLHTSEVHTLDIEAITVTEGRD